ncbi:DUF2953 domain-containing protein [Neobacillus sp. 179-C4.2 HS]|uniref:DUF2953 domain-containing protein n=1 Tax=Neobacillus driksii TaxID=3035913 RepID=A0ABV4YM53_9BACI|nr:DUF2953 domain-containing protein [Neobacillus sp. 179.-C4.2 HS]MDP5196343.1 DUF2953 domain-containing protein [Neobacillus sp. 179.-C4.2 HS]
MNWLVIALIIIILFILLIIFSKLTIRLNYFHHNDNDELQIQFRIWFGLIRYTMNVPLVKIDDDSPSIVVKGNTKMGDSSEKQSPTKEAQITKDGIKSNFTNAKEIFQHVVNVNIIVKKFMKKIVIKHFEWHSLVGVGDAVHTAIITGALWTLKGSIMGMLSHFLRLKEMPVLSITPHFQLAIIQTHITCIFQFRIGYAILAGLKLIKFWKGGRPNLKMETACSKEKTKTV